MAELIKISCAVFLSAFLCLASASAAPSSARAEVFSLQQKFSRLSSLKGNIALFARGKSGQMKGWGVFFVRFPDRQRMNLQSVGPPAKGEPPVRIKAQIFLDGKTLWMNVSAASSGGPPAAFVGKMDFAKLKEDYPDFFSGARSEGFNNPAGELSQLDPEHVRAVGKANLNGIETVILESPLRGPVPTFLTLGKGEKGRPSTIKIWVGMDNGITYQTVLYAPDGAEITRMRLSGVEINPNLDDRTFLFTAPKGIEPEDMTDIMEDELSREKNR